MGTCLRTLVRASVGPVTGLDYFTFVVLTVLIGVGLYAAFRLGELPGKIADQRGHPQADAIRVAGWIGLITLGVLWPFALIWAFTASTRQTEVAELRESIDRLTTRIEAIANDRDREQGAGGSNS
jgi:hypothetical protein